MLPPSWFDSALRIFTIVYTIGVDNDGAAAIIEPIAITL